MPISYDQIRHDDEINTYIRKADDSMRAMGFTEHSFAHVVKTAEIARSLLEKLGYDERTCELASIAGYMHDMGNMVNRSDHAQSGALLAFRLLRDRGMDPEETATVITAIGNHDESTAVPVSPIAAALILADKSDVRKSRVRSTLSPANYDIHDRVNHSVDDSRLSLELEERAVTLYLTIDTEQCAVMNYFEIFLNRMLLCRRAADYFELSFQLVVNGTRLL